MVTPNALPTTPEKINNFCPTFKVLTLFKPRKDTINPPMPNACAIFYKQSRILCCASDRSAVGPTFNISSYDACLGRESNP